MIQEEPKNEYRALAMSVLVHFVIFVLIAMTGLFVKVKAIDQGKPIDVMVYDADAGDGGERAERDPDVDVLQVVVAGAEDLEARRFLSPSGLVV